jgi:hypothetical protein
LPSLRDCRSWVASWASDADDSSDDDIQEICSDEDLNLRNPYFLGNVIQFIEAEQRVLPTDYILVHCGTLHTRISVKRSLWYSP